MSKIGTEIRFGGMSTYRLGTDTYQSGALGIGPAMMQNTGSNTTDNWTGPIPIGIVRPMEASTQIPGIYPEGFAWSTGQDWGFLADNAAAAASRRVLMTTLDRGRGAYNLEGFITVNFPAPTLGNQTIRAVAPTYGLFLSGQAMGNSGSFSITGFGAANWNSGLCAGNRIGFGTTDPTQVNVWYEVSGVTSNTGLVLVNALTGTVNSGAYVAEDLRICLATTSSTTTGGGVFVVKGLRRELFQPAGTAIFGATGVDNLRLTYQLSDAATQTNIIALGCDNDVEVDKLTQNLWVLDTTTNPLAYCYNVRKPLTLTLGRDITTLVTKTNAGGALVGTASQANNVLIATANHGPGAGLSCMYFTTTTRVYRTSALSTITNGSTTWVADNMTEVPPGGANTFAASSLMNTLDYAPEVDKFVIAVNATTTPFRSYVTQYRTDGGQFDRIWGLDNRQIDQSTADAGVTPVPSMDGGPYSLWAVNGLVQVATIGTTAITNRVYTLPLGADWEYGSSTSCRIITPAIQTPNCDKFQRVYINNVRLLGGATGKNLGSPVEPFRTYYRTTGISDNSGSWTVLDDYGDLSGVAGTTNIQFMFEFRTIGLIGIPSKLLSVTVLYNDLSTDSHYQPSVANSSITTPYFAYRFATAWGSTVPTMRIRLYDAVSGGLLVDDNTASPSGTFQKSTDGGANWGVYSTSDKGNETTYVRYLPASLGSNIKVRALFTQL